MILSKIFKNDIKREIPPVIFFHDQDGEKVQSEVSEYIITGGWPKEHPNYQRVSNGIHEQYVRLLNNIAEALKNEETLPAAWISGFYGSGKSLFSKLLGLALDGMVLPNGKKVEDTWLERNSSPKRKEMTEAWQALRSGIDPVAIVFDIGGSAKDNEQISTTILRHIQQKLGYCKEYPTVARYELRLERDGKWPEFLELCKKEFDRPWEEIQKGVFPDEDFSLLIHKLRPKNYPEETSWLDAWGGKNIATNSAEEIVQDICDMIEFRAPGKHLFVVVDEVSQYIHQNESRMLSLQSFVSELGAKLRGRAWLLVTGQEKLEEASTNKVLGKLKDRFPPKFRVHLNPSNIRDVVHKRLLEKNDAAKKHLQLLLEKNRANLQLYAYGCKDATLEELVEVYPMLPGQIDLLMEITSEIRARSDRAQGDAQAIRGLMQMLGELFRETNLAEQPVGTIISIDQIFEIQLSSLPSETQESLARIFSEYANKQKSDMLIRVVKVVALLSMVNEKHPTDATLIARCLYNNLDSGDIQPQVEEILKLLTQENTLGYSTKFGYSIHSSAAQEWQQERDRGSVSANQIAKAIQEYLRTLLSESARPKIMNRPIDHVARYIDKNINEEVVISGKHKNTKFYIDLYFTGIFGESNTEWINRSSNEDNKDRLFWISGSTQKIDELARKYLRSAAMCSLYRSRAESLNHSQRLCLINEDPRREELDRELKKEVENSWMSGKIYFRGREITPTSKGQKFKDTFTSTAESVLKDIFPNMKLLRVDRSELSQLTDKDISSIDSKFMSEGAAEHLGIFSLEEHRYIASCSGEVPSKIASYIESRVGIAGKNIIDEFERPPYGYEEAMIMACVAGLLRAERIYIVEPKSNQDIRHFHDPGAKNVFERQRDFSKATIYPVKETEISPKDRNRICKFFKKRLDSEIERENPAIADAAERHFPALQRRLDDLKLRLRKLPNQQQIPKELQDFSEALGCCIQQLRNTQKTVSLIKEHYNVLNDGVAKLHELESELSDEALDCTLQLDSVMTTYVSQLKDADALSETQLEQAQQMQQHLKTPKPWHDIHKYDEQLQTFPQLYTQQRKEKLGKQQQRINETLAQIRRRKGFGSLKKKQAERVLEVIHKTKTITTEDDTTPSLVDVETSFIVQLQQSVTQANEMLDTILSQNTETPIVAIKLELANQQIENEQHLDQVLADLKKRVMEQLKTGAKVRFTES